MGEACENGRSDLLLYSPDALNILSVLHTISKPSSARRKTASDRDPVFTKLVTYPAILRILLQIVSAAAIALMSSEQVPSNKSLATLFRTACSHGSM